MKLGRILATACFVTALALPFSIQKSDGDLSIISGQPALATSGGGPIVLDGMDPVCHSGFEGTWGYIAQVLKKTYDSVTSSNNGTIAVLGANGTTNSCGGNWNTLLTTKYLGQFTTAPTVNFYNSTTQVNDFFTNINTIKPAIIWIPDNWSRPAAVESIFTSNAEKIADFVNSGGGIFANNGTYGWLTALLPSAVYNNGGCNGGPDATADGTADFGLTNTMVAACWHGYFTGNVGTLKTLVDYPYPTISSTRKSVSIGGGSVSLPSSFTLGISPASPNAGEDLTITATAQTLAGVAQPNVVVTVTVSAGPDAGKTFTATTNASGIATITIRTNTQGTAVYTATATVNGVAKTVSATVSWNPPTTTLAPATTIAPTTTVVSTTTIAPTTTQAVASSSTTIDQTATQTTQIITASTSSIAPIVPTTVHDHSSHHHGELPQTGVSVFWVWASGLILMLIGFILSLSYRSEDEA